MYLPALDTPSILAASYARQGETAVTHSPDSTGVTDELIFLAELGELRLAPYGRKGSRATSTWQYSLVKDTVDAAIHAYDSPSLGPTVFLDHPVPKDLRFLVQGADEVSPSEWQVPGVLWRRQMIKVLWLPHLRWPTTTQA
jgi:hypothetical protein